MEQLYVFGTGNAAVTRCYNTCFALRCSDEFFMTDAGGGNGILGILENMNVDFGSIHHIFVTHEHTDHILGIVWMVRFIATRMKNGTYDGDLNIYCHDGLISVIDTLCRLTLQAKFYKLIGERIHLTVVKDGESRRILDHDVVFFDIHSTKARQFGFTTTLSRGEKLTCCGDEPYNPACADYVKGSDWLLHEAFCMDRDKEKFKPYEKHHSTVKDACELAEEMNVKNLVLWHTEDSDLAHRTQNYKEEGEQYYSGRLCIPEDGDIIFFI